MLFAQLWPVWQAMLHPPQLDESAAVLTQAPLQFVSPVPHESEQLPSEHT